MTLSVERVATQQRSRWLCHCGGRVRPPGRPCGQVTVDPSKSERPDLAIYGQLAAIAEGAQPTWDNPDMITNDWGPFRLRPEATVVIRNLSPTTPAVNALVHYSVAPFGIGTRPTILQTRTVSLGAASQVELNFPLDQDTLGGDPRVGVHIRIEHPRDSALLNNQGSQVHDGSLTSEVGLVSSISIPVLNDSNFSRRIDLTVLPSPIVAAVSPTTHLFAPNEEILTTLNMTVPGGLAGQHGVTVIGRLDSGELVGGATKLIRVDT